MCFFFCGLNRFSDFYGFRGGSTEPLLEGRGSSLRGTLGPPPGVALLPPWVWTADRVKQLFPFAKIVSLAKIIPKRKESTVTVPTR